ncbi:MAG TPA: histidinol dehydrogenase [Elusimicrobia bacterium]|nr:histidinol dehydrogenase [Elusimicrobiota bacterium]
MNIIVKKIIEKVKKEDDSAVSYFTKKYDGVKLSPSDFMISEKEIDTALENADNNFLNAVKQAKKNIEIFQKKILPKSTVIKKNGIILKLIFNPIEKVGIYIPGGRFSYPSTIWMTAIPAKIAGVKKIVMVSPPKNLTKEVIATAKICGVDEIYRVGGVQGIAALACGTKTIPKVDKIVGPGNVFVTEAKRQVFGDVGIDMLAGPSEVLIIADDTANPDFIISDLTAQCEHDKNAKATLVSVSKKLSEFVKNKISEYKTQIKIIRVKNIEQAIKIANEIAPEHIEIMTKNSDNISRKIRNVGAIFLGNYSPVAVGDYFAGPSHVLPTNGTARFSSGLSVYDFLKSSSVISYEKSALKKSAKEIMKLAETEGLFEHANSVKIRTLDNLAK